MNRVTKGLTQRVWPADLDAEAHAFVGSLNTFAAILTAGDVEGDVEGVVQLSEAVHDAQHAPSHHIDAWMEPEAA